MKIAWGTIASLREDGFQLTRLHESAWFRIGMDVVVEGGALRDLLEKHIEVTVHYDEIPDERYPVAYRIFPAGHPGFSHQAGSREA